MSTPVTPVVNVITVPDDASTTVVRTSERKLARGFTITVSAPPDEKEAEEILSHEGSWGSIDDMGKPFGRSWEPDHLAPDEFTPEVPLEKTESRLPSLEDMLGDEEIKKMLETSDIHREIQEAIMMEDEATEYEQLMSLVQKSFENSQWRLEAGKDKHLIDTLVLFVRQRLTEAQNPFQLPGGDFMGRSTRTLRSLSSRTFARSNTHSSESGSQSPGGGVFSHLTSLTDTEQLQRAATALALAGPAVKLLRNFCVGNRDCQIYIHEHRLLDLLLDHMDLISEVAYQVTENGSDNEPKQGIMIPNRRCTPWAASELSGLPRSLVQLVTNVVTGNPYIQAHILEHIFPDALLKIIVLSGDADLLSCLLHCLTVQQSTLKVFELLIADPRSAQIWYLLLSAALRQADQSLSSIVFIRQMTTRVDSDSSQGEWLSLFMSSVLRRQFEGKSFFIELVRQLLASDVMSFRSVLPKLVLSHPAPSRSPSRSASHSRRSSYELGQEWQGHVHFQVDKVLVTSKSDVVLFFFSLIEALLDGELGQQPIKQDSLSVSLIRSPDVLKFLSQHLDSSIKALHNHPDPNDEALMTYRKSFIPFIQIVASLTAVVPCVMGKAERTEFNVQAGSGLMKSILRFLDWCHKIRSSKDSKWAELGPSISRRDLLLVIANLCYKSHELQIQLATENGIPILLNHSHIEEEDPLMEQASIFAIRNSCQGDNQRLLHEFLNGEFRRIHLPENCLQSESVVIGRFDGNDEVVKIDQINL